MKLLFNSVVALALLIPGSLLSAQALAADHSSAGQFSSLKSPLLVENSNGLPDAPQAQSAPQEDQKISPSGKLPAVLAPQVTSYRLSAHDKWKLYAHQAFNPFVLAPPAVAAGFTMINPPSHYPHEWKAGGDGFGRLYGDFLARTEAERAAQVLTDVAVHEDPRYSPSTSTNYLGRTAHAIAFVVIDHSDSGHNMPALSNFAGAAASGFVSMAYMPNGYDDATHAGQRSLTTLLGYAGLNITNEFCPEWAPIVTKLHIPLVHPTCKSQERTAHP